MDEQIIELKEKNVSENVRGDRYIMLLEVAFKYEYTYIDIFVGTSCLMSLSSLFQIH